MGESGFSVFTTFIFPFVIPIMGSFFVPCSVWFGTEIFIDFVSNTALRLQLSVIVKVNSGVERPVLSGHAMISHSLNT